MVPGAAPPPGQTSGNFPKDVAGNRYEGERGKDIANAEEAYTSLKTKLPGLQAVVTQLNGLADKATYTQAGQVYDAARRQLNLTPRDAAVARKQYTSMVDNQILPLLRDTFGAQFTEREGNTLRATLGDPDTSPQEKKAVLNSFIEQKVRDVEALRQQSLATSRRTPGYTQPSSGLSAPANLTPQGFANWARANKLQPGTPVTLSDGSTVYTP